MSGDELSTVSAFARGSIVARLTSSPVGTTHLLGDVITKECSQLLNIDLLLHSVGSGITLGGGLGLAWRLYPVYVPEPPLAEDWRGWHGVLV